MSISRKVFFISFCFIVFIFNFNVHCENYKKNSGSQEQIKIVTYNLHLFLCPMGFEDKERQSAIENFIQEDLIEKDIIFFSEMWKDSTKNEITEKVKNIFPYSLHSNSAYISQGDGLLILSKFPIEENYFFKFKDSGGFDAFTPKGFHAIRFSTPQGDFFSFFTHMQADGCYSKIREKQLNQIKSFADSVGDYPNIILGDFNIARGSDEYFSSVSKILHNYADSYFFINKENSYGYTYDNTTNRLAEHFYPKAIYGKSQECLDYIFVSKTGWDIISSSIIDRCKYYSKSKKDFIDCSDHYGIETNLILKSKKFGSKYSIANYEEEAKKRLEELRFLYGKPNLYAKIIIYNNSETDIFFKNKTGFLDSTFFSSPPEKIPAKKYGIILAIGSRKNMVGVYSKLIYTHNENPLIFFTATPNLCSKPNSFSIDFFNVESYQSADSSKISDGLKISGEASDKKNSTFKFTVEKSDK